MTSVEEAIDILDARRPRVVTLRASPTDRGEWPDDPPTSTPAVTIVLDRILLSVPPDDRRAAWAAGVQRVVGNLADLVSLHIDGISLSIDMLKGIANRSPGLQTLALTDCTVDDAGAQVIGEHLPNLTSLGLVGNRIGEPGAAAISGLLQNLTVLRLGGNQVGEVGARVIADRLHDLTSLDLDGNAIGDEGARDLTLGLPKLSRLSLETNRIGEVGARAVAERLYRLTHLDLGWNRIGRSGAGLVAKHLYMLTSLDLRGNAIGNEGAQEIAQRLANLTTIELGINGVGDAGARAIASHLPNLTTLGLRGNEISDAGMPAIAEQLTNLTTLDLCSNRVRDEGVLAIARGCSYLVDLNLRGNTIGPAGARAIAAGLTELVTLDLGYNRGGNRGVGALTDGLPNITKLGLSGNQISDAGARRLAEGLPQLVDLNLADNKVSDVGVESICEHLLRLTHLDLRDNPITDISAVNIAKGLVNLTQLALDVRDILFGEPRARAIADHLQNLTRLTLRAAGPGVGEAEASAIAAGLPLLTNLDLKDNQVGDAGAAVLVERLPLLTWLGLSNNQIGEPGVRAMLDVLAGDPSHRLRSLHLGGNDGLDALGLREIGEQSDVPAMLAAYRRLSQADDDELVAFGEAKLVVLGNEGVGKTSLIRALVEGARAEADEAKTPGVKHRIWITPWAAADEGQTQLNIWDFGGQEIMHQTHRYFLTERCIHLIVLDRRYQDDTSVHTWLQTVAHRASSSPVVVVVNKCDDGTHNLDVDFERLRREHPEVVGVYPVSCAPKAGTVDDTMAPVRDCLRRLVTTDERLTSVHRRVPTAWVRVREAVRAQAEEAQVLSAQQYVNLCRDGDDESLRVDDPDEQNALLQMLHQIGTVVAHGLTPTTASLTGLTLLDPNWFTTAVYALLDYGNHEFDRRDLGDRLRLDPDRAALYPDDRLDYIVDLLQQPEFALAFRLPGDADPARYLLPEALTPTAPTSIKGWDAGSLRFRFRYERLPRGLIPQFQVLSHDHAGPRPERWRAGCTLVVYDCPVLVDGKPAEGIVDILVAGPAGQRRDALAVVRDLFQRVHDRMPETVPVARVPLPAEPDVDVGYDHLRMLEDRFGPDYAYVPEAARNEHRVGDLLSGVRAAHEPRPDPPRGKAAARDGGGGVGDITIVTQVGQAANTSPLAAAEADAAQRADAALGRRADAASLVGALAGVPLGTGGAALYLLGQSDGWPLEVFLAGAGIGGMSGAIVGALLLGRRPRSTRTPSDPPHHSA